RPAVSLQGFKHRRAYLQLQLHPQPYGVVVTDVRANTQVRRQPIPRLNLIMVNQPVSDTEGTVTHLHRTGATIKNVVHASSSIISGLRGGTSLMLFSYSNRSNAEPS